MREQLRQEVLRRFAGAPDTQQARDLRDEILSNTLQRYDDLPCPREDRSRKPMPARSRASAMWRSCFPACRALRRRACTGSAAKGRSAEKGAAFPRHAHRLRHCVAMHGPAGCGHRWYGSWGYAWAVFPLAAALLHVAESVILLARGRRAGWRLVDGLLRLCICVLYAVLTAATGKWIVTWLVFPIGAALGGVLSSVRTLVEGV